jgi:hypothetical protein
MRRESLELGRQPCWRRSPVALNNHVRVVGHNFQSVSLRSNLFCFLVQQFSQAFPQCLHEDTFAVLRAPPEVLAPREGRPER